MLQQDPIVSVCVSIMEMWPYAEEINFPARFILPSLKWYGDGTTDDNINSSSLKENIQIDIVRNNIVVFYPG